MATLGQCTSCAGRLSARTSSSLALRTGASNFGTRSPRRKPSPSPPPRTRRDLPPAPPCSLPAHSPLTPHSLPTHPSLTHSPLAPHSLPTHSPLASHSLPTHSPSPSPQERSEALFTFSCGADYVADICWSPDNSTVFASVTGDGRLDVWDISVNTLDPLTSVQTDRRLSTVAFSNNSPVLVVGHEGGVVDVYSLNGSLAESTGRTVAQQVTALERVTDTNRRTAA